MDKKAADEEEHVMRLDPGPRRRSAASSCSFCLLIVIAIIAISGLIIVPLIFKFVSGIVYAFREPHHALYHNTSAPDAPGIHPLLRANSTFDIVATVWVRAPRAEEREFNVQQGGSDEEAEKAYDEAPFKNVPYLLEYPLFSDVVFRGLRMHDKHNSTEVNFTLPTARFQDKNFTILDLRASFVLIPSSPSLLDHLVNFSSWRPDDIGPFPVRPWPLPDAPASASISSGHLDERSLLDAAIDSFGFFISLLEVQEIASACVPHNDTRATPEDSAPGDVAEDVNNAESTTLQAELPLPGHDEEKPHKKHPHVVTRTQLRLIIDENVYNLTAYNAAHEKLKATACGRQNKSGLKPARGFCTRSYRTHGPLGTRLEVMRPTEEMSEWLYAPYLASLGNAAGPMDQLPIPVNRENCSARNMSTLEASTALPFTPMDSMNVTWHLSFTGRTPAKDAAARLYPHLTVPHNATMLQRQQVQELSELASGLFGYRYHKDAHPRRRLFVMGLRKVAEWTASLFTLHYWYTCSSTVGLSLRGQVLYASVDMMEAVFQAAMKLSSGADRGALYWAYTGVFFVITHLQPLLMFKALWRFELLSAGWHLYLRRSRATHRERASARLDAQPDWRMIAIGSAALVAMYYTLAPWRHAVLGSFDWSNTRQSQEGLQRFYAYVLPAMLALRYVTDLLQLAMNIRTRTFAGRSRVAIALLLLARLPKYPIRILGLSTLPSGVSWDDALSDVSLLAFAWQALTMRLVDETAEDDDGRYTSYIDVSSLIIRYLVYFWRLL